MCAFTALQHLHTLTLFQFSFFCRSFCLSLRFCIITTSSCLICLKIILKNRLLDKSLLKRSKERYTITCYSKTGGHICLLLLNIMYSVSNVFLSCLKNGKDSVSSYLCTLLYFNLAVYELNSLHSTIF